MGAMKVVVVIPSFFCFRTANTCDDSFLKSQCKIHFSSYVLHLSQTPLSSTLFNLKFASNSDHNFSLHLVLTMVDLILQKCGSFH